jgi:hypothetical protein
MPSKRIARCCCGSLRAQTMGDPELVAACSCGECQRRTGSVVAVSGYWQRDNVVTSGSAMRYFRKGHGGGDVELYFCPVCGSTVYWVLYGLKPEWVAIAAGMFVDANFPSPSVSVWEKTKPNWLSIPADLHFDEQPQEVGSAGENSAHKAARCRD